MPELIAQSSIIQQSVQSNSSVEIVDATVRRILIYRTGSIGDTVIALPALWAIRRGFPNAHVALLSNALEDRNYASARSVLPQEGLIDEWLTYPTRDGRTTASRRTLQLLIELRRQHFDTLVYLAPRGRNRMDVWRDLVFYYIAGMRRFVGHRGIDRLPQRVFGQPQPAMEHEADHLVRRLELSRIPVVPISDRRMDMAITASESEQVREWLAAQPGRGFDGKLLIGIGAGSNWSSKTWPEERYGQLGQRLIHELDVFPVLLGGPNDIARNERLIARWGRGANAAGQLTVRQAAAVLAKCRLYVGNDTGTMHMAAAVETRCVVAFSAQDWPGRWYPYGKGHVVLRHAVPCAGCMLRECDRELQCLTLIEVDDVFEACRKVLATWSGAALQTSW